MYADDIQLYYSYPGNEWTLLNSILTLTCKLYLRSQKINCLLLNTQKLAVINFGKKS